MTLEELWELFPIFLVEHNDKWRQQYEEIEGQLAELLSDCSVGRISHIGSTAVKGIWAKDIVDVLVEFPGQADLEKAAEKLEHSGFTVMSNEEKGSRSTSATRKTVLPARSTTSTCGLTETTTNCTFVTTSTPTPK